jgi:hypothetical protein
LLGIPFDSARLFDEEAEEYALWLLAVTHEVADSKRKQKAKADADARKK